MAALSICFIPIVLLGSIIWGIAQWVSWDGVTISGQVDTTRVLVIFGLVFYIALSVIMFCWPVRTMWQLARVVRENREERFREYQEFEALLNEKGIDPGLAPDILTMLEQRKKG